jgi:hypothetical protein
LIWPSAYDFGSFKYLFPLLLNWQGATLSDIKRLVLDVMKPHSPSIIESIKITIEGHSIDFDHVKTVITEFGAVIHSVDGVSAGRKLVDEVKTPQDG